MSAKNQFRCEYCGKVYHGLLGFSGCNRLPVCAGMNYPPKKVKGAWRVHGSAVVIARTAGDMLLKSPAARTAPKCVEMGQRIIKWADRAYKALEAVIPVSLGFATKTQNGFVKHVEDNLWKERAKLPNLYVLEIASRCVNDSLELAIETNEGEKKRTFWFDNKNPKWLQYDAIAAPLAILMSQINARKQTAKELDVLIRNLGRSPEGLAAFSAKGNLAIEMMLEHAHDEHVRSLRYLDGCINTAMKEIRMHGTQDSLDLVNYDPDQAYQVLFDYIWQEEQKPKAAPLKMWLIGERFWVAAENKKQACEVLMKETGHVLSSVKGVHPGKKLYGADGQPQGTVADILSGIRKPSLIGVE